MTDLIRIPALVPFERMVLSPALDGSAGTNRAAGNRPQIAAQNDIDALKAWLARVILLHGARDRAIISCAYPRSTVREYDIHQNNRPE